jgi:prepilin-type N-terminal cleavage/methylation domain-containing protein
MIRRIQFAKAHRTFSMGFTMIELLVAIAVIGILASLVIVSYRNIRSSAIDVGVQSDLDSLDGLQADFGLKNNTGGKAWYSPSGLDTDLNFTPSPGNVIDVVVSSTEYCIRGYNVDGNKNSINNAFIKESTPGICGSISPSSIALSDVTPTTWSQISVGQQHMCAVANNARAYCWGLNDHGQLGNNSTTNSSVPVAVSTSGALSGKTITSISAGTNTTCAVASDGNAYCWGDNAFGQLGNNSTTDSSVPVAVSRTGVLSGKTALSTSSGFSTSCVIASDSRPYCWGDNAFGQLGNNTTTDSLVPVAVTMTGVLSGKTINMLANSNNRVCVLASDSNAYCWGGGTSGQLGTNVAAHSYVPIAVYTAGVLSGKSVGSISYGVDSHSCVIASDANLYCWGLNTSGQVGNNSTANALAPVAVIQGAYSGKSVNMVSTGSNASCIIASDNKPYCWGDNQYGQLGNNSVTDSMIPVAVTTTGGLNGKTSVVVSTGNRNSCVLASDSELYCWGDNATGQLGNGTTAGSRVPILVNNP